MAAQVMRSFIARTEQEPRMANLRKWLAGAIWPGELVLPTIEQPAPATGC